VVHSHSPKSGSHIDEPAKAHKTGIHRRDSKINKRSSAWMILQKASMLFCNFSVAGGLHPSGSKKGNNKKSPKTAPTETNVFFGIIAK